jgi:hypothetical protein
VSPIEYVSLPRDSKREIEVLKWLRKQNDHDKFEFVWQVLMANVVLGLVLVERSNLKPIYLEVILEHGFVYGDASSVRGWYEATAGGLGIKKVILMVYNHIDDAPLIVDKMIYWLSPDEEELKKKVMVLRGEFNKRYPGFKSSRSTGIHSTSA